MFSPELEDGMGKMMGKMSGNPLFVYREFSIAIYDKWTHTAGELKMCLFHLRGQ